LIVGDTLFFREVEYYLNALEWGSKRSVPVVLADKKSQRAAAAAAALAHIDELLDDALKATFPASDPVAISIERGAEERERLKS
jgi:hypothetical protein